MRKFTLAALALAAFLPLTFAAPVSAQPAQRSEPMPEPALEPRAMALLEAMSRRLAAASSLSFNARVTYDVPTADRTPVFLTTVSDVSFRRPASLRVVTVGDGPASVFVADGGKMARFEPAARTLASRAAPSTIDALIRAAGEHGIDLPYADVLLDKPFGDLTKGVTSAFVVGQSRLVGGVRTNIVSVTDATGHMQLWIGEDNLPRQVWVTESRGGTTTRNMISYANWAVNRPLRNNLFSTAPWSRAKQTELKPVTPVE